MMTKSKEVTAFGVLDRYARSAHACFVAEMFANEAGTEYTVCFRPVENLDRNSANRFDCRYFRFSHHEVEALKETNTLTAQVAEKIDNELRILGKSA
jgi:hypothetical protein